MSRIIRALNVKKNFKSKMKLFKLLFELILYLHCSSCLVWGLIQYEALWNHPVLLNELTWSTKFYSDAPLA